MSASGQGEPADEALRTQAGDWYAKLGGSPDEADLLAFEEWYSSDPRHARAYDNIVETDAGLERLRPTATGREPDRLAKHVVGRITRTVLLIAAGLVLALVVYAGVARAWLSSSSSISAQQQKFASAPGQIRTVTLLDGSRVTLDSDSALAVNFTPSERRLTLMKGRARFDVAHDPNHPFIVTADGSEVVAHGTIFDVDLDGKQPLVSLLRGLIEVRKPAVAAAVKSGKGKFLQPGQALFVGADPLTSQAGPSPEKQGDWTSGMLSFDDRPLSEIVAGTNRYAPAKILLTDPDLGGMHYSISFPAKDSGGLAQALSAAFNLAQSRDSRGNILLSHRK
ncbi:FecR family protein [Novosphingobium terrae]|uniref:FecR family protein n=1 Tax=Novosphingobium terrae TaxID=2726189 RepID=UPI00197D538E|nr:FecR domain-containing protein [Novosphingobium terrae]